MAKLFKMVIYGVALAGIIMISTNGYIWYKTGKWGGVTFLEIVSYITGKEIEVPEADPKTLQKWVDR